ncbi:MAG TPA: dipeptide epimerase [Chthonomonadaceae bacterium]|nr:dipeptide epimerase [Chthonomonadaceae bacterium]
MPAARIAAIAAEPFHTPLHNPFVTSQGSTLAARAVAIHLTLEDGRTARGESVPVMYVTGETRESVLAAVERATPELVGLDVIRYRQALNVIGRMLPEAPSARCGLEMAVLDAWAQTTGGTLWGLWGAAQDSMESDITIPMVPNAGELARLAWELGIRVFKIKVGEADAEADHARVLAVHESVQEAPIRIDANQAFTPEGALRFVERLLSEGVNVQLLEQPVKKEDVEGLAAVAARSPVPVFADESARTPAQALRLATTTPVHGFNLKINKNGIAGVLDIIAIARAADRRLMLGCMLETRRSIAVSLALACGTGAFEFIDLDSHLLLMEADENAYFHQEGGRMTLASSTERASE